MKAATAKRSPQQNLPQKILLLQILLLPILAQLIRKKVKSRRKNRKKKQKDRNKKQNKTKKQNSNKIRSHHSRDGFFISVVFHCLSRFCFTAEHNTKMFLAIKTSKTRPNPPNTPCEAKTTKAQTSITRKRLGKKPPFISRSISSEVPQMPCRVLLHREPSRERYRG